MSRRVKENNGSRRRVKSSVEGKVSPSPGKGSPKGKVDAERWENGGGKQESVDEMAPCSTINGDDTIAQPRVRVNITRLPIKGNTQAPQSYTSMSINLPVPFVKGEPVDYQTMDVAQAQEFIRFMYFSKYNIPLPDESTRRIPPSWWPPSIGYDKKLSLKIETRSHSSHLMNLIRGCYSTHGATSLLAVGAELAESVRTNRHSIVNDGDKTKVVDRHGRTICYIAAYSLTYDGKDKCNYMAIKLSRTGTKQLDGSDSQQKPTVKRTEKQCVNSVNEQIVNSVQKPIVNPVQKPIVNPVQKPIVNPAPRPVAITKVKPAAKPNVRQIAKPVAKIPKKKQGKGKRGGRPPKKQDESGACIHCNKEFIFKEFLEEHESSCPSGPKTLTTMESFMGALGMIKAPVTQTESINSQQSKKSIEIPGPSCGIPTSKRNTRRRSVMGSEKIDGKEPPAKKQKLDFTEIPSSTASTNSHVKTKRVPTCSVSLTDIAKTKTSDIYVAAAIQKLPRRNQLLSVVRNNAVLPLSSEAGQAVVAKLGEKIKRSFPAQYETFCGKPCRTYEDDDVTYPVVTKKIIEKKSEDCHMYSYGRGKLQRETRHQELVIGLNSNSWENLNQTRSCYVKLTRLPKQIKRITVSPEAKKQTNLRIKFRAATDLSRVGLVRLSPLLVMDTKKYTVDPTSGKLFPIVKKEPKS